MNIHDACQKRIHALEHSLEAAEQINRELQLALAEQERVSGTDRLTGAWTRARFEEVGGREISLARRGHGSVCLVMYDLDKFKLVNDTCGHAVGDAVLRESALIVRAHLRVSDSLIRWGGEEFLVLAPATPLSGGLSLAEKIRLAIDEHVFPSIGHVTVSLGVAEFKPGMTLESWIECADEAMYRAKGEGRNQVRAGTVPAGKEPEGDWGLESEAIAVLSRGAFKLARNISSNTPFQRILSLLRGLARDAQDVFEDAIRQGKVATEDVLGCSYFEYQGDSIQSLARLFDVSRVPGTGFDPPKFGTPYDALVDEPLGRLIDGMLEAEPKVNTATIIDLNGYIPMHPSRVCQGWTGNREVDLVHNRCKKFYLGASLRGARVGLAGADHLPQRVEQEDLRCAGCDLEYSDAAAQDFLVQTYSRDTGETLVLLTVPVFVMGRRYGAATATWAYQAD